MDVNKFGVTCGILGSLNMKRILFTLFGIQREQARCPELGGAVTLRKWILSAEVEFHGSHFEFRGIDSPEYAIFSTTHFIIGLR